MPGDIPVFWVAPSAGYSVTRALRQLQEHDVEELIVVSTEPHGGAQADRSLLHELLRQVSRLRCGFDLAVRALWYDDAGYIDAQAGLIRQCAAQHGLSPRNAYLVYIAPTAWHAGLDDGGQYLDQVHRTIELVSRRLGWPAVRTALACQGRGARASSVHPDVDGLLSDLAKAQEKRVLLCPLRVAADAPGEPVAVDRHVLAQFEGGGGLVLACSPLSTFDPFVGVLRDLVLRGRRPVTSPRTGRDLVACAPPVEWAEVEEDVPIASLALVGVSLAGCLEPARGPALAHVTDAEFRQIRRSRCDAPDMLRAVCASHGVREVLLWNTCRRLEIYAWLTEPGSDAATERLVRAAQRHVFGGVIGAGHAGLNVLRGGDAWRHLMRTAEGLNSGLPGELEVLQQLDGARHVAIRAGSAGPVMERMLAEADRQDRRLREETGWGAYRVSYCAAAMSCLASSSGIDLSSCRCAVIGGSSTSCQILRVLRDEYGAQPRQLTLLHRGHGQGGQLKSLRRAIGTGRRIRVHNYTEPVVLDAIAQADAVFIGLDRRESVLPAEWVSGLRDFATRPVVIADFNAFGSTTGLKGIAGIRLWEAGDLDAAVAAFSEELRASEGFTRAVGAAEAWIDAHVPSCLPAPESQLPRPGAGHP